VYFLRGLKNQTKSVAPPKIKQGETFDNEEEMLTEKPTESVTFDNSL